MDLKTRQTIIRRLSKEYKKAKKKERGTILTELVRLTEYNRSYAATILRKPPLPRKRQKRIGKSRYATAFLLLRELWVISNFSCGKLLVPAIPTLLDSLSRHGELKLKMEMRKLLLTVSPATCDRLLKVERRRLAIKGRSGTKPGSLLKNQIPVRVFTPWNEEKPGFVEVDLVAHCGESLFSEYINTLNAIDVATTWSERWAFMGRSQAYTIAAFKLMEKKFPFSICGIDSDNDAVFINAHFFRYAQEKKITFTRSRAYRKNDQAHVEQKNWSIVRKYVGYQRLDKQGQLETLNQLYEKLSLYLNFFIPTMKLVRKEHVGAKVKRIYDKPKTPYQRVLTHSDVKEREKKRLRVCYLKLNPKALLKEIVRLSKALVKN